jgi:hypothetical protein
MTIQGIQCFILQPLLNNCVHENVASYAFGLAAQTTVRHTQPLHPAHQSAYGYTGELTQSCSGRPICAWLAR